MWSFGYTNPLSSHQDDTDGDVLFGEENTFSEAIRQLHENVLFEVKSAEEYEIMAYEQLLIDISDIMDDPGIMDDPDQWEDQTFTFQIGDFSVDYWIVES